MRGRVIVDPTNGLMHLVEKLSVAQLFFAERKEAYLLDSS
jgi:hypothetical protein